MFMAMKEQGMSISEIARRTRLSRETVRKYIAMEKPAKYSREGRWSVIAPYTDYVMGRIDKFNLYAVRIYDEIREKDYLGSYTTVKRLCRELRRDCRIQAVYRYETYPGKQPEVIEKEFGVHHNTTYIWQVVDNMGYT